MRRGFPTSSTTRASAAARGGGRVSPGGGRAAREGEIVEGATPVFEPLVRHELGMIYAHQYAQFSSPFRGVAPSTEIPGGKVIEPARKPALGQRNQAGQQQSTAVNGHRKWQGLGRRRVRGSGPAVRSSWQSLGRCSRSAVYWVGQGMNRFGEFLVPTHAVAVASDVDDVAWVGQAVEQRGGQDREAKDQTPSGDVSVGPATCQIPAIP